MVSGTRGGVAASSGSCPDPERAERGDRSEGIVGEGKWGRVGREPLGFRSPRGIRERWGRLGLWAGGLDAQLGQTAEGEGGRPGVFFLSFFFVFFLFQVLFSI